MRGAGPDGGRGVKILEIANVDFSLRQFVLPLMRAMRAAGHEVIGVSADGPLLADIRAEGFRVIPVPFARSTSPRAHLAAFRALVRLMRAERPDLVHAHMPISGFLARAAARATGVPRVAYTCHGFLFKQEGSRKRRVTAFVMEWLGGRLTDIFLTVSVAEAAEARRRGIARGAVAVGNGRDPARFRPDPDARARLRAALGTPEDRPVILAVSRLVRTKGYPELAAAMRMVPAAELWVVGERLASDPGPDMNALLDAAGLGPRLRRLGYRADMPAVMAAADIFTLPSYFEGLPVSIIEAMLCGLPVVASDIPGPREQVVPEETGLLVPAHDARALAAALTRLIAEPDTRARMGAAGRVRAEVLFDERKIIARTLDLLGLRG